MTGSYPDTRLRRLRRTVGIRRLLKEPAIPWNRVIYPVFVIGGYGRREAIESMPGQERVSADLVPELLAGMVDRGLGGVLLFAAPDSGRDSAGSASLDAAGIIPRAVESVKRTFTELPVFTDVCLCAYTDHGHCGLLDAGGGVDNDKTLDVLARLRERTDLPIAAYNVSGEYAMATAMADRGWGDRAAVARESLVAVRRAGADIIITYWPKVLPELFTPLPGQP